MNGSAVTGYLIKRYDAALASQTILSACTGTITATTCVESGVPDGSWRYSVTPVFATNWRGVESAKSGAVVVDTTPPVNVLSLSALTGNAFKSGTTVFYRGAAAGSFTLTNAVSDAGTGPASSTTAALAGTTAGWTHSPATVSAPAGGPYVSNPFSWTASTSSAPTESVTGLDVAGNTVTTALTFTNDTAGPTAGALTVNGVAASAGGTTSTTSGSRTTGRRPTTCAPPGRARSASTSG